MYIALICAVVIIAIVATCLIVGRIIHNKIYFGKRCDPDGITKYFTHKDFDGLDADPIEIKSGKETLRGYYYHYGDKFDRVMVLPHGMFGGHLSYTKEIEWFARHNYVVLSYDNTGTFSSSGKNLVGLSRAIYDLDNAINFVKKDERYGKLTIDLYGHSWAGFAVSNVIKYQPNINAVVAVSGFSDVKSFVKTYCDKWYLEPFLWGYMFTEFCLTGKYAFCNRNRIWKKSNVKKLVIHGVNDKVVSYNSNVLPVKGLAQVITRDSGHSASYTLEAEKYCEFVFSQLAQNNNDPEFLKTVDWHKACQLEQGLFDEIYKFLRQD